MEFATFFYLSKVIADVLLCHPEQLRHPLL